MWDDSFAIYPPLLLEYYEAKIEILSVSCIDKTNRPHQKQHGGPLEAHLITDMRTHIYARIRLHIPYLANATGRP